MTPRRRIQLAAVGALLLLAGLVAFRVPLLVRMARVVEVRHEPVRSDLILLLSGDGEQAGRADHAARLFHAGLAPTILVVRAEDPPAALRGFYPNDSDVQVLLLRDRGVPASAIRVLKVPGGASSTMEEARLLAWYLRRNPASRVTVVTTEYHTRRASWAIRRATRDLPAEIRISGARDPRFHAGNWWRSEDGMLAYFAEYVKWAHNALFR
jgi:uncharacterized SAM-binding protein YcdF (DUF218 family)